MLHLITLDPLSSSPSLLTIQNHIGTLGARTTCVAWKCLPRHRLLFPAQPYDGRHYDVARTRRRRARSVSMDVMGAIGLFECNALLSLQLERRRGEGVIDVVHLSGPDDGRGHHRLVQ